MDSDQGGLVLRQIWDDTMTEAFVRMYTPDNYQSIEKGKVPTGTLPRRSTLSHTACATVPPMAYRPLSRTALPDPNKL
ncbi:Uncharacterized protein APZ42_003607 [Daphnia magna]|uniref:Uncharacterized protein n=1 Tax=Daphnia magna TaxID=35525 RepID=A0A168EMC0_9CRUS|nr:Uncharacterized protein APZ42_003607 [Daphnia magna]